MSVSIKIRAMIAIGLDAEAIANAFALAESIADPGMQEAVHIAIGQDNAPAASASPPPASRRGRGEKDGKQRSTRVSFAGGGKKASDAPAPTKNVDAFNSWWTSYPRKIARRNAAAAYDLLIEAGWTPAAIRLHPIPADPPNPAAFLNGLRRSVPPPPAAPAPAAGPTPPEEQEERQEEQEQETDGEGDPATGQEQEDPPSPAAAPAPSAARVPPRSVGDDNDNDDIAIPASLRRY